MENAVEAVNTYPALFWGYTVIWILLVGYIILLGRKVRRVERAFDQQGSRGSDES